MRFEFSAGGVVYRRKTARNRKQNSANIFILVAQHSQHHGWIFPKGLIGDTKQDESKEETALREVKEETGITARIIQSLEPVTYWFQFKGEKIKKTVYYFLMEYVKGDTKDHDWEMEKVEWLSVDEIEDRLTYPSDKKVWQEARQLIAAG